MKTIIHVNQAVIRANRKDGTNLPPLIVRNYKGSTPAHEIQIHGPSEIIHRPHDPLRCGARVWIETLSPVTSTSVRCEGAQMIYGKGEMLICGNGGGTPKTGGTRKGGRKSSKASRVKRAGRGDRLVSNAMVAKKGGGGGSKAADDGGGFKVGDKVSRVLPAKYNAKPQHGVVTSVSRQEVTSGKMRPGMNINFGKGDNYWYAAKGDFIVKRKK